MNTIEITHCRACGTKIPTQPAFSLGEQCLSDFGQDWDYRPPKAPLTILECVGCGLAQLSHTVARSALYHDRYGYRSGVNQGIRDNLRDIVAEGLSYHGPAVGAWLDIASNDGTLLSYVPREWIRVGIDPVQTFAPEARVHADRIIADYFNVNYFVQDGRTYEQFDVITSISMFYDLHEPAKFVFDVRRLLTPQGVWIIQQNYLHDMFAGNAFDNICHEHLTYFDLRSLEPLLRRHGLQVVHVERSPVNGGCFRTVVAHVDSRHQPDQTVQEMRDLEAVPFAPGGYLGEAVRGPWDLLQIAADATALRIKTLVEAARAKGEIVYIYGASTRGAVIWQHAGLTRRDVASAVEAQAQKVDRYYSAVDGIPIVPEEVMRRDPGLTLVGPYWHRDLFVEREHDYLVRGGRLVFPLPRFETISWKDERDVPIW